MPIPEGPMIPASDIYQSSPDWIPIPVVYYHYYPDLLDPHSYPPQGFPSFLLRHLYLVPRKRFLFIDLAIETKTPRLMGRPVPPAMQTRARRRGSISRGLLFLPIRDTQCFFRSE
ncbi:hypothetical protein FOXG_17743 [Fusarium oxysporum f. sp. lycopersici 4287]|uniref:Uncharacterized protein n=2 Tax=Fusarium oxysporum TaxID=5507 RepID=A0A0J9UGY9_FUSO4|nr:hypothetical protein FOXG_17743 [Fusarium oxysporum f. sp. lycopersici 4287]KNA98678.1 hypothetical protein FOXG_17743 [Fusarium oxysporum f. sp. lycopersici 4287]